MAGNSKRPGSKKGKAKKTAGSGGRIRRSLAGRGPTPKAEDRVYHKAYKAKQEAAKKPKPRTRLATTAEWVVGRNPVYEALLAGLPVKNAYVAEGAERDDRLREIFKFAAANSIPLMQVTRAELDRMTGLVHQGVALQLPAYSYADPQDLIEAAAETKTGLLVALDGITDPRNLGAIVRSAAAFGADGIIIPSRRSATMTAAAWKTSAGAAARLPIAKATNLNRALEQCAKAGFMVIGLAGEAEVNISEIEDLDSPVVLVIGSEGAGLARLVRQHCDQLAAISIANQVESLNASVAAAIALYEVNRIRTS